jgi:hypothetical protein
MQEWSRHHQVRLLYDLILCGIEVVLVISSSSGHEEVSEPNSAPRKELGHDPVDHHQWTLGQKVSDELVDVGDVLKSRRRPEVMCS